jgi:hypothetical protein
MTGRAVALSLVWLGVVALVLPGAAQAALVVALLHLGIGVALPALVGKPSAEDGELPATLVLLSIGRAVAALAAVRGVVGPPVQMGVLSWLSEALGPPRRAGSLCGSGCNSRGHGWRRCGPGR